MKRLCSIAFILSFSLCGIAQVKIGKLQELKSTKDMGYYHPVFSPRGDFLLFSTANYRGLMFYDVASAQTKELNDADMAGYEVKISEGGKIVVYRKVEYIDNRRYVAVMSQEIESGKIRTLREPGRLKYSFDFNAGRIRVADCHQLFTKPLVTDLHAATDTQYIVAIEDFDLVLYTNHIRRVINPVGKGSYLWPSLSADGKFVLFYAAHRACAYVYDIKGKQLQSLGYIDSPQWLGNDYIVGTNTQSSDGENYTASPLVFIRRDGEQRMEYSVPEHPIVLYPAPSRQGDKVAFEADGSIYILNIIL